MSPITRPPPLPSMFRPSMEASATTTEAKTNTHGAPTIAIAATTAATMKRRAGTDASTTATGRRAPSLISGSTKTASGDPAQVRLMPAQAEDHIAPSDPGDSGSPPSAAARPAATLGLTSRVDDAVEKSCSAAGPVAVEATSVTAAPTTAAATAAASAAAASAASEAGTLLAPFPATTILSAAATAAWSTGAAIPSVERKDSSPRDSKQTARGASAANDGDIGAGGGGSKKTGGDVSTTKGERRAGGGSSRQIGGSGRSCRPTGTVMVVGTAAATAMAASTSANVPKEDSSANEESLLPSTNNSREHNSGHGVGGEVVVGVAPAGSLVRLKKRRQQARTRANNQR